MADTGDSSGSSPSTTYTTWNIDIPSETTIGLKVRTLHAKKFTYATGGIALNVGSMSNITGQFSDSAGAGNIRYDATNKKVVLYRGGTQVSAGDLSDLTIRIFGN